MEAASLAFSVAQTLLTALQSPEIRGLFSMWGYKSKLEDLERTVETVKSVLLSADSKQVLTPQERDFIDNLKDVVYEADDLIDEFLTTVALQQQHQTPGKVQVLFRRFEKLGFAYKMSRKVKNIRKMLDRVADDAKYANIISFKIDDLPIRKRREEMTYVVNADGVVGRDYDKNEIIETLLDPNCGHEHVYVVTIVGMGGLGKTCLAQLVYNDPRIQKEFPITLWVCVSDEGKNKFDVKSILVKILKLMGERHTDELDLVQIADKLKEKLVKSSRYLLVLDDVWTENRNDWVKFKDYLSGLCQIGNKIVVTTRSEGTATAVGSNRIHKLKGLSDDHSWRLFEMAVGSARANSTDFEEISRDIVKKCHNVPLALKVVGNLLYAQEKKIWISFQNSKLSEVRKTENDIMPILEFSYRSLSPSLKSCFTYCALFPKDFKFNKEKLLDLWMAQDYVEPLDGLENIEDAADEYFKILARRCFFQDLENNRFQEAVSFKIHDLMHDMAQQVAGEEISIANSTTIIVGKRIRHVYDNSPHSRTQGFMVEAKIRTYLILMENIYHRSQFPVSRLLAKWRSLRTLDMRDIGLSSLPDTIGQLLHLRYLDLSHNGKLEMLPKSLTKLINLQFLNLDRCHTLKELPRDLSKLVNLRTLYVPRALKHMPAGLARMTHLTRLNYFIVNQRKSCQNLEELRGLRNLKGSLDIRVNGKYEHGKEYCGRGEYMCNTLGEHLNSTTIDCWDGTNDEQVLEDMQPHSNLKELTIWRYSGVRMGRWAREDSLTTSLPNLVKIVLYECFELKELPWLGILQHLKTLKLNYLRNVEYMENRRSIGVGSSRDDGALPSNSSRIVESSIVLFFPSLEELYLEGMGKLKGWWMGEDEIVNPPAHLLPSFPRLSELKITGCPNLTSFPLCPCVETLPYDLNEIFQRIIIERGEMGVKN